MFPAPTLAVSADQAVVKPTTLGSRQVKPGELCWQLVPAANRDPRVFKNPNMFRFDRGTNPHLASFTAFISASVHRWRVAYKAALCRFLWRRRRE
jgi:cytochrome P450